MRATQKEVIQVGLPGADVELFLPAYWRDTDRSWQQSPSVAPAQLATDRQGLSEFRHSAPDPQVFWVEPGNAFFGNRILDETLPIPHRYSGI